jgi:hypothetical protein
VRQLRVALIGIVYLCAVPLGVAADGGTCDSKDCSPQELHSLKELPVEVLAFLRQQKPEGLADRGEEFNPSDVIYDERVPRRRFVVAIMMPDRLDVEIEYGGIAYFHQTFEFHRLGNRWVYASKIDPPQLGGR